MRLKTEAYKDLCKQVLKRDGWRCQNCGATENLQVHHIRSRSRLGHDASENLITLCARCHELAGRRQNVTRRTLYVILITVLASILLTSFVMQPLLSLTLGLSLPLRIALGLLLVGQLGLLLGLPFSTGLSLVADEAPVLVPWAWAVNGFFAVIGSVAAMILGMVVGFSLVFLIATGSYAFASVAMRLNKTSEFAQRLEPPGDKLSRSADHTERARVATA